MLQLIAIAALLVFVLLQGLELRKQKDRIQQLENGQSELRQQIEYPYTPTTTHTRIPTRNPEDFA